MSPYTIFSPIFVVIIISSSVAEKETPMIRSTPKAGPPRFRDEHSPTYFEVPLFQKLKLRCTVSGSPRPATEWFKFNESLTQTDLVKISRHSLTISNVSYFDDGLYYCKASNIYGTIWQNFTVKITEPYFQDQPEEEDPISRPVNPGETFAPYFSSKMNIELLARPAGSSVVLKCPAIANPPGEIVWLKNGAVPFRELNKEIVYRKYSLIMDNLQLSDSGTYECIISNTEGKINFTYMLDVEERLPHRPLFRDGFPSNTTVYLGGRARFECRFVSDLAPRMIWLRHLEINGSDEDSSEVKALQSTDPNITDPHILVIDNVTYEDEGYYVCLAGNSIGVSYRSAYLRVLPPPEENTAREKTMLLDTDNPSLVIISVICISGVMCFILFLICRYKYNKAKEKFEIKRSNMIVTKKVIFEKREDIYPNSCVPFVKIDYNMVCSTDTTTIVEYELPVDSDYEFPRERLKLGNVLGEGAFAKVVRGKAFGLNSNEDSTTVAVKMLKEDHVDSDMLDLVSEIELMKIIGKHLNILSLQGCCTQGGPLYAIVEYAANGNLRDYLRARRKSPPTGYEEPIRASNAPGTLSFKNLISYAYQTAKGMEYLISKGCIHRDLAARNLLLTEDDVIKIADFGLARDIHESEYYKKHSNGKLPIKWMAPEALSERIFTSKSDVWSYGIVLYEILTLGGTPYPTIPYEHLYQKLKSGHRMSKPDQCPMDVYILMRRCWADNPKERPSFGEIVQILDRILLDSLERVYLELDLPSLSTPENSSSDEES